MATHSDSVRTSQVAARTRPSPLGKWLLGAIIAVSFLTFAGALVWKALFPHGRRCCAAQVVRMALAAYANDHQGWFPNSTNGPAAALQSLYPDYSPTGTDLAGISGDIPATVEALRTGRPLDDTLTSWRYLAGLRDDDDPKLALLWEAKSGLNADGRRNLNATRVVILVSGRVVDVAEMDWPKFLEEQEILATAAKQKRQGPP